MHDHRSNLYNNVRRSNISLAISRSAWISSAVTAPPKLSTLPPVSGPSDSIVDEQLSRAHCLA
jgi:hypothetical protein